MAPDVAAAWLHSTQVDASFMHSFVNVLARDLAGDAAQRLALWLPIRCASGALVAGRNEVAAKFLASPAQWLWWIDTDMGFEPDALERLVAAAHPRYRPVVGGLCFAQLERGSDGMGGFRSSIVPALYRWHTGSDGRSGFVAWEDYPRDLLVEVAGTGSAFVLIHRSVFEKIADRYGAGHWYDRMVNPSTGQLLGEDLAFCARARAVDVPVHVHTGIRTTHRKPAWIGEDDYRHPDRREG